MLHPRFEYLEYDLSYHPNDGITPPNTPLEGFLVIGSGARPRGLDRLWTTVHLGCDYFCHNACLETWEKYLHRYGRGYGSIPPFVRIPAGRVVHVSVTVLAKNMPQVCCPCTFERCCCTAVLFAVAVTLSLLYWHAFATSVASVLWRDCSK